MKLIQNPMRKAPMVRVAILWVVSSVVLLAGCSTWQRKPAATLEPRPLACNTHLRNLTTEWEANAYSCQVHSAARAPRERSLAPRMRAAEPRLAGVNDAP